MNFSEGFPTSNTSLGESPVTAVLSDDARVIVEEIVVLAMLPLNIIGVITNTINIRVFAAQGVKSDNTNIGFLSLSIFDLLSCMTVIPYSMCYVIKSTYNLPQHRTCVAVATQFLYAHLFVQQSSAWTTVYMSIVRSLCVYIPLKVKQIFTPSVTFIVILFIFIFFFVIQLIYIVFTRIVWAVDPNFNESFAYVIDLPSIHDYNYYTTILNYHVLSITAIITVSVTTSLMVHKLFQVKKWRQKNASGSGIVSQDDNPKDKKPMATKDIELVKSVTTVTCIFMVCLLVSYLPATATVILPGVNFSGINSNLYYVIYLIRFFFDAINSSINFFFYIRISSRYKNTFATVFPVCWKENAKE